MLLNPNAVGREKGGKLENVVSDPFVMPVPGQSLTDTPGKWPWDGPPEITNVDDALTTVLLQLEQNPKVQKSYDQLITLGMPIESIVNTISFGGFVNGLWSVDIGELLKQTLQAALMLYADEKQLPFVISNNQGHMNSTELDDLSDFEILETMKENNPLEKTVFVDCDIDTGEDNDGYQAWDITTGNSDVIIAILDTGVDLDHPDLINNIFV